MVFDGAASFDVIIDGIAADTVGELVIKQSVGGMGNFGVVTTYFTFSAVDVSYVRPCAEISIAAIGTGAVFPKFFVNSRSVKDNVTTFICTDRMGFGSKLLNIPESMLSGDAEDAFDTELVLAECANILGGLHMVLYFGNSYGAVRAVPTLPRAMVEGQSVHSILELLSTAFCGFWRIDSDSYLAFVPFNFATRDSGVIDKYSGVIDLGTRNFEYIYLTDSYNNYGSFSSDEETLSVISPLACDNLYGFLYDNVGKNSYNGWSCENMLVNEFITCDTNIVFSDGTKRLCNDVKLYLRGSGIYAKVGAKRPEFEDIENIRIYERAIKRQVAKGVIMDNALSVGNSISYYSIEEEDNFN